MLPVGYIFFYCVFLFYVITSVYVVRSIAVAVLLRDVVAHAELHTLPLHPDKAGELLPVGRLGLRNQYALTLLGLNVVLSIIAFSFLKHSGLMIAGAAAIIVGYFIFGPLVFMAPLLPFHSAMLRNKAQLMTAVGLRMRQELDDPHSRLLSGTIAAQDEQMIERLRKIGAVIDELPVWPFDAATLRKFLTAYAIPFVSSLGLAVANLIMEKYFHMKIPS